MNFHRTTFLAVAFLALLTATAYAQTFTPVTPAQCPSTTTVPWTYNISNSGTGEWMVESDPNIGGNYANNINYSIGLAANTRVNQFGIQVDQFSTETNFDKLHLLSSTADIVLTGTPAPGFRDLHSSIPSKPLIEEHPGIRFFTDTSITSTGIVISQARVCTDNPAAAAVDEAQSVVPSMRYSGVLLGQNDVVYFSAPVGGAKSGQTCSASHDTFAMWGAPTPGNDFDLYVRCGALPTPTQWDFRGFSSDTQEFVHATTASCPCGSTWYVAVHAFSGSGAFSFVNHKHFTTEHRSTASVRITCDMNASTFNAMQDDVLNGFKHFFGANEGTRYWDNFTIQDKTDGSGELRIHCQDGRPNSDRCGNNCYFSDCNANFFTSWTAGGSTGHEPQTFSHEMGHHYNCLWDEYESNLTECGHSIMASPWGTNQNYCYCNFQPSGQNKCSPGSGDHGFDPTPPNITSLQTGTAWINLQSRSPYAIQSTPDNFNYESFDFNQLYATPVPTNL